jgi:hypothetical protein
MAGLSSPHNAVAFSNDRGKTVGQRHKHLFLPCFAADKIVTIGFLGKIDTSGIAIAQP